MGLFDDVKKNAVYGLFIGVGAAILAPAILPILASIARPLSKGAIKGGILLYEKGKESVAEAGEKIEDLLAEVKAELSEEQQAAMALAAAGAAAAETGEAAAASKTTKAKKPHSTKKVPA